MILVIGARASGKRDYVESLGYAPGQIADGVLDDRPVLYNLQTLTMADPEGAPALLESLKTKEVVVCDEVGSGVIPLAKEAAKVVRLVAGIPTVIKG